MTDNSIQSMYTSDESQHLLAQARSGNDTALWRLAEQMRPYLKAVVRQGMGHNLASKVDDSDIVQQAMVRAVDKFDDFDGATVEQWQAWLVTIAHNEARNTFRYWHQQRRDAHRELRKTSSKIDWAATDESTPSQVVMRRERAAKLMSTIQQLPQDQQQLLFWRHFDNLSHREIAEKLGISEVAARQRWKSVLDRLNKLWDLSQ